MGLFSIKKTTMGKIAANLLWNDGLRQWHPTPVLLPGKSHGWRSLVGCSPWGCYKSDTTERLHFHALEKEMATHSRILAWRIPGTGEPGGLPSTGSHRVGHDWSDLAAAAAVGSLKQPHGSWRVEIQHRGTSRVMRPLEGASRKASSLASAWLSCATCNSLCSLAHSCITQISAFIFTWLSSLSLCLCPDFLLLTRTAVLRLGLTSIQTSS